MNQRYRQDGFAAIAAIFLVVVLAALGGFMVSMSNSQQIASAQDVMGTRAYWAAKGGVEWGVASAYASSACPTSPTVLALDGFSVSVTCTSNSYVEGASSVKIMGITAVASQGTLGSASYVERSVSAGLER